MAHYTKPFLEAIERLTKKIEQGADPGEQFFYEMQELGWKERVRNLYRIKDKDTGKFVFFQPNQSQAEFEDNRIGRDEILKSRQIGFSTWSCIYAYDRSLFDGWSTGIMSHLREKTGLIFEIIKNANSWFKKDWGKFFKPEQEQDSAYRISWIHNKATITVSFDFRSLTVQFLHVSEAAYIDSARLTGSLQSVPQGGEIILESTSAGSGGFFYNQWQTFKREGDLSPFKGHFFPWFKHYPEDKEKWENKEIKLTANEQEIMEQYDLEPYHMAWRRWKILESFEGDDQAFEVEYPSDDVSCFLSGQNQIFPNTALKMQESYVKEPSYVGALKMEGKGKKVSFYSDKKGLVEIWDLPKVNTTYVMGVDTAEGVGKDYNVAIVLNKNTGEQVAQLRGFIPPSDYWEELYKLGHFYGYAHICPEINSIGSGVVADLVRNGYGKLYKRTEQDELNGGNRIKKVGFRTTTQTKAALVNNFVAACKEARFRTRSKVLLNEMSTFVQVASKTGKSMRYEARSECHDDCVIAAALAWEMADSMGDTINDKDIAIPENMMYDHDTGFLIPIEGTMYG